MTYVVTEACIRCKYMDCVEVCPVDCFYEGENMLVIHPDECIDCGVCEPECPVEAILPDTENAGREMAGAEPRVLAAPGPTSPASARRPTTPTSSRARRTSSRSISARSPARHLSPRPVGLRALTTRRAVRWHRTGRQLRFVSVTLANRYILC